MEETIQMRVKKCIIERLNLKINPDDIDNDAPIFAGAEDEVGPNNLGLDSIDALELVVALGNEFGVTISDEDMNIFGSVNTIAQYIEEKMDK